MGAAGVGLMVVGGLLNTYSTAKQLDARRRNELEQQQAYSDQADQLEKITARKLYLLGQQQDRFQAKNESMLAASGVSFEGSALQLTVQNKQEMRNEYSWTQLQGEYDVARLRRAAYISGITAQGYQDAMMPAVLGGLASTAGSVVAHGSSRQSSYYTTAEYDGSVGNA